MSDLLLKQVALRRTLSEGTLAPDTRSGIAAQLLAGKVSEPGVDRRAVRGASALVVGP